MITNKVLSAQRHGREVSHSIISIPALLCLLLIVAITPVAAIAGSVLDFGELSTTRKFVEHEVYHAPDSGFKDMGKFSLMENGTVTGLITDENGDLVDFFGNPLFDTTYMKIIQGSNVLLDVPALSSATFNFGELSAGNYTFTLDGGIGGPVGSLYKVGLTFSPIPLPAAAWLLGSAVLGFVGYSTRRKV